MLRAARRLLTTGYRWSAGWIVRCQNGLVDIGSHDLQMRMTDVKRESIDSDGKTLHVGDRVRVLKLPPDSFKVVQGVKEFSLPVFEHLIGKYKQ